MLTPHLKSQDVSLISTFNFSWILSLNEVLPDAWNTRVSIRKGRPMELPLERALFLFTSTPSSRRNAARFREHFLKLIILR